MREPRPTNSERTPQLPNCLLLTAYCLPSPRRLVPLSALNDPGSVYLENMPSFDIVSEVDKQEIDNALNQAKKELSTRFDFKDSKARIERTSPDVLELTAEDAARLRSLMEIMVGKLAKRGVDLRNVDRKDPAISPLGHARQEIHIKQGLEGDKAKEITKAIKAEGLNVQCQLQDRQIRVTGKKKDDLQTVIQLLRRKDFGVALNFKNFRD
jgi:cyclic-di-GMP-binding protein